MRTAEPEVAATGAGISAGARRLAILADFPEEGWPSMDLTAEMLHHALQAGHADEVRAQVVCPEFRHRVGRLPVFGRRADRLANRLWDYPRYVRRRRDDFDLFHVVDHSYAHLVHALPPGRTGVYCHDLDTFRCLLEPECQPRPRWFREMARRILRGLQSAAVVFHNSMETRQQIERHALIDPRRLVFAPLGVSPEYTPEPSARDALPTPVAALGGAPYLLHVGSCIPRKRIDVLLNVFAEVRGQIPGLYLVKVGADWSRDQRDQIERLGIDSQIVPLFGLERLTIAALYRTAAAVLLPSESEGFGLPIIEALACGSAVVASDLPVLREVGGNAVIYCPVGNIPAWAEVIVRLLTNRTFAPARPVRLVQAAKFSWTEHARIVVEGYRRLL